ncbi:MAG TPA: alpha/beta hydrolase [Thermoleophilaceae bacterium]|nr:alpha/beta hydrolase [Thermoleophilaceae bacterium]
MALALLAVPGRTPAAHAAGRYLDFAFGDWTLQHNVEYGRTTGDDGSPISLTLDLYQPAGDVAPERPVLIYAHGGAFTKGNKESGHDGPYAMNYALRGFVAASIDYRLTGSERDATDDMQAAVRWFRAHATEYRVDPDRIGVIGSSSGAVMALSTAFAPEDPGTSGNPDQPSDVASGMSISGSSQHPDTITAGDPPIAMFHAMDDTTIPYARGQATCEETKLRGNVCDFYSYPTGGHPPPFAIENREDIAAKSSDFMVRREGIDVLSPATDDDVPADFRARPVPVTLTAGDDGGSGVHRTYYTTGVDPPDPTTASAVYDGATRPSLGDGERIRYFSLDRAGNSEPVRTSRAAKVDGIAPTTDDDVTAGYRTERVPVTLTAHDGGGSGLAGTHFTTGADPPEPTMSSPPYDPASKPTLGDGERIRYFSVDEAGNAEPVRTSVAAQVDAAPPTTADDVPDEYRQAPVAVTLAATDDGSSGVATTYYTTGTDPPAPTTTSAEYDPDARPVLGDGERIRYLSVDRAGNAEAARTSAPARVDTDSPSTADDVPTGYRTERVAVTLAARDDGGSGVAGTYYTTGVDPPAPTPASAAYDPGSKPALGDGERIRYLSIDRAGNAEPVRTSPAAKVDAEGPATTDDVPDSWRREPVPVALTAADEGSSGVDATRYTTGTDPGEPTAESPVYDPSEKPLLADGERIRYRSTDRAGNSEPVRTSAPARVDALAPSSEAHSTGATVSTTIGVDYTAEDAGSGLERVELYARAPGESGYAPAATAPGAQPSGSFEYRAVAGPGDYSFYAVAYDAAGNSEAPAASPEAVTELVPRTRAAALESTDLVTGSDGSVTVGLVNPNPFAVLGRVTIDTASPLALRPGGPRRVRRVGQASFSIPARGTTRALVKIRPALRALLARRGRLAVRVRRPTAGPGGRRATATVARLTAPLPRGY